MTPFVAASQDERVFAAARVVLEAGLGGDGSAFTPERQVWTRAAVEDLHDRFVARPLTDKRGYMDKWREQLGGAPQPTIQLAAELLYIHLLVANDYTGAGKRDLIMQTLAIAPEPVTIPVALDAALDAGVVRAGTAFLTLRDRQIKWLVLFVQAWKALPVAEAQAALRDPWRFREFADRIQIDAAYTQRNALLLLAFPDTFIRTVSRAHKRLILTAFADELPEPTGDEDRDLLGLQQQLQRQSEGPVNFYQRPLLDRWQSDRREAGWLVRGANVRSKENVIRARWLPEGYCSTSFGEYPEVAAGLSKAAIAAILLEANPDLSANRQGAFVGILDRFLNRMQKGDVVVTVDDTGVYVGRVASAPYFRQTEDRQDQRRRDVTWLNPANPYPRSLLPEGAQTKLQGQMTVSDLGAWTSEYLRLANGYVGPVGDEDGADDEPVIPELELPDPTQALADELLLPLDWLWETVDLLREKQQIVLYGPPGTGKTFVAQALATYLTEATGGDFTLVQFHPSYAYEDFFEGFRPQKSLTGEGGITFDLLPGPFKRLALEAESHPGSAYFLLIDEMNRANLAKVFGELYSLLEYRDRKIALQYSPEAEFSLPANLYVIGTMNTADRSIALVDAAMRRRFYFQALFPGQKPLDRLLRDWLEKHHLPGTGADLLDELNEVLADPDGAVGPSYLMTERVGQQGGVERVWRTSILPLLQERHFGERVDVDQLYGVKALQRRLDRRRAGIGPDQDPLAAGSDTDALEETGEPVGPPAA